MRNIFEQVKNSPVWEGIGYCEFENVIRCMESKTRSYGKGDIILMSDDRVEYMGMIVSGSVKVKKTDPDGNEHILTEIAPPGIFGEVFACAGVDHSPVTVQAAEKSEVLFMNYRKVITSCSSACAFHSKLIENMLKLIARKNLSLNQKLDILSKRTTKEKLLAFFDNERGAAKKFAVPYNREEMAQYLCVDRSAMSNELCKMRNEGLINFKKNMFEILY